MIDLYTSGARHQTTAMRAMVIGINQDSRLMDVNQPQQPSGDKCVAWGIRHMDILKKMYKHVVVMERGYFNNRMQYYSLGIGGLNNRADFNNVLCNPDRWMQHGVDIGDWKEGGDYYLVMGQVDGDMSIKGVDINKWYSETIKELQSMTDKPVYFRAHPQARARTDLPTMSCNLKTALKDCAGVVTYNSNSGVDAILAGVPAMASDRGSMAWNVAAKSLEHLLDYHYPDRSQWLHDLAYTQWTIDEIMEGKAWAHLWRGLSCRSLAV